MTSFLLSDAELHGLIDGQIEVHHRADILRRAATSTPDRERIGSWQTQCELIRAAFQGVDREPVPSALDLRAPAKLHLVPPVRQAARADDPPIVVGPQRRNRWALPSLAALIAVLGLAATWAAGGFSLADPEAASTDEILARRTTGERSDAAGAAGAASVARLPATPTAVIPDLTTLGFALTGADMQGTAPASILFHYRNALSEQITLGVARTETPAPAGPARVAPLGRALVWHATTRAYALAGSLPPERLRALAPAVRDLSLDE